jgi:hypothetical protein
MKKPVGRPRKKLVAGKLPKEQYEIAKKKQQDRIDELEQDPRYQEKMDTNLLNEYDFEYQGKKKMAEQRQKAMQSNPKLYNAWKRKNDKLNFEIEEQRKYEREQERLRQEAEEKARQKANDPFSNVMSGLSAVASLIPGMGTAISSGLDVVKEGVNLGRDTFGGGLKKGRGRPKKNKIEEVKKDEPVKKRGRPKKGGGLFDDIKNKFIVQKKYNNKSTKTLKDFGNGKIIGLKIMRTPIMGILNTVLNGISFGQWGKALKSNNIDTLFHLALIADTDAGRQIVIEKNEQINISTSYNVNEKSESQIINLNGLIITVNEMLEKARQSVGDDKYFLYDGLSNNCQWYIRYILESNGLYSEQAKSFLFQSLDEIKKDIQPYVGKVMNAVTDTGAIVSQLLGKGLDTNTIHAIKYKKPFDKNDAIEHFYNVTGSKKKNVKVTELKKYYKIVFKKKKKFDNLKKVKYGKYVEFMVGDLVN